MPPMNVNDDAVLTFIIQLIDECYGYDFSNYSKASLKRRFRHHMVNKKLEYMVDIVPLLVKKPGYFIELLSDLSVTVTEMFRDPDFYKSFVANVLPVLKKNSYFKIWHAGCSSGEEVYSMAITLQDNDCLSNAQLYGTDFNPTILSLAKKGIYPVESLAKAKENYQAYGGSHKLTDYVVEKYNSLKIIGQIQQQVVFSEHNLATDKVFGEVDVVVCRNVMIYFDRELKKRVINLFRQALPDYGFLCLGDKESLDDPEFKCIDQAVSIYQKVPL